MSELRTNRIVPRDGLPSGSSGGIIQVVSVTKTDVYYESVSEGSFSSIVTGLTPTITPTRSDSKILITGYVHAAIMLVVVGELVLFYALELHQLMKLEVLL